MARGPGRFHRAAFALGVAGVLALAGGLRLAALGAEFWFDEVWSWELARSAGPAWRAFFGLRHDNNHPLNTLFLSCCPEGLPWAWYRAHSLAAGPGVNPLGDEALADLGSWWSDGPCVA